MSASQLPAPWRLVAAAAAAVFVTLFLPWYSQDTKAVGAGRDIVSSTDTLNAWQAFSFVEAAVLLVVVGVGWLLFSRVQGKAFHLPGGDGAVVAAGGLWVCFLVFYRQLDKPDEENKGQIISTFGVTWGIFVTFLAGATLAYAGIRLRQAKLGEPALPGDPDPTDVPVARRERAASRERERSRAAADELPTSVAPRSRPRDRTSSWLGREGAARDLGGLGAAPTPASPTDPPTTRRRARPAEDEDQPRLPFDD